MSIYVRRIALALMLVAIVSLTIAPAFAADPTIGINVVLKVPVTTPITTDLGKIGRVGDIYYEINALRMVAKQSQLPAIRAKWYVSAANPDAARNGAPIDTVAATNFMDGMSTWDLDAINVTDHDAGRQVAYDGTGVYVAVIDTGLVDLWRQFFPQERIATQYGISFQGGGALDGGKVSISTNKWEHDQNSHGTHVTSTILGYSMYGTAVNGVAPMAKIVPVKVLNQNGSGWSSVVARGIVYVADLKKAGGPLENSPVVINMSLGGPSLDAMEKAAIDYAITNGVIVVASAGNNGMNGMGYPGAYAPVISVASTGWTGQWTSAGWWHADVADPTDPADFYIASYSSRQLSGQDLDIAAPGTSTVGPYLVNSGQISYYYLSGTSMASPHVAGIVALMAQKNHGLNSRAGDPLNAENFLEQSAINMPAGCRTVLNSAGASVEYCWGADATGVGLVTADGALALVP